MVYGFLTKIMFGMKKATRSFWVNIVPVLFSFPELCISAEMKLTKGNVQLLRFDGFCKRSPDTAITMHMKDWKTDGKNVMMNSTFEVTRDVTDLSLSLNVDKCRSKENPDSCQNVYRVKYKNTCQIFKTKTKLWTPVISKISPEWKCPLKKGIYTQTDGSFDVTPIFLLPVQGWYWKALAKLTDKKGKILSCFDVLLRVTKTE